MSNNFSGMYLVSTRLEYNELSFEWHGALSDVLYKPLANSTSQFVVIAIKNIFAFEKRVLGNQKVTGLD